MIKKYLQATATVVGLLALPAMAFAAFNDVTLGTDTKINLTVGDITYNVVGDAVTVESIVVNPSNFMLTLASGSSATVTSADNSKINDDAPTANVTTTCTSGLSKKVYTATGALTVTVTPSGIICSDGSPFVSSPTPSSGGGGAIVTPAVVTVPTTTTTPAVVTPAVVTKPITQTPLVPAIIKAQASKTAVSVSPVFTRSLGRNQKHADALRLQKLLAIDLGITVKETGKFDFATKNALKKFQIKYGIAKAGKIGYGTFGPTTRAKFGQLFELGVR